MTRRHAHLPPFVPVRSVHTEHGQDVYSLACGHEMVRFHRHVQPARTRCGQCLEGGIA